MRLVIVTAVIVLASAVAWNMPKAPKSTLKLDDIKVAAQRKENPPPPRKPIGVPNITYRTEAEERPAVEFAAKQLMAAQRKEGPRPCPPNCTERQRWDLSN